MTRAALRMVADHARALAAPPGVLSLASEYFKALLLCRTSGNKNIRQAASPATDAFLSATADALADASTAPEAEREAVWTRLSEDALALIDARDTKAKERTVAVRAVGKLARAGFAVGGFGAPSGFDPDAMLARIALDLLRSLVLGREQRLRPPVRSDGAANRRARCVRRPARRARRRPRVHETAARLAGARRALGLGALLRGWRARARGHARAAGGGVRGAGVPGGDHHAHGRARIHLQVAGRAVAEGRASRPHRQRGVPRGARAALAQVRGPVDAADARRRRREPRADGHARVCDVRRVRARDAAAVPDAAAARGPRGV